jgi:hypothetical protein
MAAIVPSPEGSDHSGDTRVSVLLTVATTSTVCLALGSVAIKEVTNSSLA